MKKIELSISADYVPKWGVTEAVREFFQNALDEETADSSNKMFFEYDPKDSVLKIGNKHSVLDIKTLLLGQTSKRDNSKMIGSHGEGYKVATVVLLREEKTVVFYNYCNREIWKPRIVKSRKYGGISIPTFFIENMTAWSKEPEHSLIIEISGITQNEYNAIVESNLRLQKDNGEVKKCSYGRILMDPKYTGKVFVSGLYICTDSRLEHGLDFNPSTVRIDRDRDLLNSFDVQYYASRMWEETKDKDLISKAADSYSGAYMSSYNVPDEIKDQIAEEFINTNGAKAIPVIDQDEATRAKKKGYKPIITTSAKKAIILQSNLFEDAKQVTNEEPPYDRLCGFIEKIENKLSEDEVAEIYSIADAIKEQLE